MAAYQQQGAAAWGAAAQQQQQQPAASQWTAAQQQQWQQQQAAWQQQAAAQQQAQQGQQQGWQQQNGANGAWQQQQQQGQQAANSKDVTLVVTGCSHATVGGIVRGTFQLAGENHGKPTYKKDGQVNGLDVMTYFWDERDGAGFCGWWFGPKVGGDQVWAYHSDKAAMMPPQTGWKVPYDGPVDPTFVISVKPKGGAQAAPQQQQQQQGQQQAWGQQQQGQQQAWGQQQQQQWTPQQNAQYQQQMAQKMQEQKRLQEQQQQLQQLKQQQQMQVKQQQMAEQKRKLEENRQKLEEMNRQRQEEQKKQAELMRQKQEEAVKKRHEELERQKAEQQHVLAIRRVLGKLRSATISTFDACKAELDEVLAAELEGCGSQKERIMTESEQAIVSSKERMEQLAAEKEKQKEAKAKALELLGKLEEEMSKAEEKAKGVTEEVAPLKGDKDMTISEIEACATAVEDASKEAQAQAQVCAEFIQKESTAIKAVPQIDGEEPHTLAKDLHALTTKLVDVKRQTQDALNVCKAQKMQRTKKALAQEKLGAVEKVFKKYAKTGELTRKDVQAYAKGEFKFPVPTEMLDTICNVLIPEGAKGIPKENSHRLLAMIGIAREGALDEKRRAARLAREKEVTAKKEKLQEKVAAAAELGKAAAEKVKKLEEESADAKVGPKAIKDKSSSDLTSIADGVESALGEAKDSLKSALDAIAALNGDIEAELKAFLMAEVKKLESSTKPLDGRITKAAGNSTKLRTEATKRNAQELDKIRSEALEVIRHHQGLKDSTNEDMFKEFAGKSDKIQESAFVKFFAKNKMPVKEGEEAKELSEESLQRLFSHLDSDEAGHLTKEQFITLVKKFMKVTKASVISDGKSIKSKMLRRLEEGEVVELITAASVDEESEVKRMRVKALQDDMEGWVTPVGNAGTKFLEDGGTTWKVVKETILTGSFVIGGTSNQKDRKLKVGEIVEVREWAKKEEGSGLMRMQVCVKADGQVGWATSVGNTGIKFLEMQ